MLKAADELRHELSQPKGPELEVKEPEKAEEKPANKLEKTIKETTKEVVKEVEHPLQAKKEQPALPQKKGQNEFVEFVEPKPDNQLKHVEQLEKRVSSQNRVYTSPVVESGNLLYASMSSAIHNLSLQTLIL